MASLQTDQLSNREERTRSRKVFEAEVIEELPKKIEENLEKNEPKQIENNPRVETIDEEEYYKIRERARELAKLQEQEEILSIQEEENV